MQNCKVVVQRLIKLTGVKNQSELSKLLKISRSFLSQTISKNSTKTILSLIIDLDLPISLSGILADEEKKFEYLQLFYEISNDILKNPTDFLKIYNLYINQNNLLFLDKIKLLKGANSIEKVFDYFSGNSGRSLRVFYFFICYLEKEDFNLKNRISFKKQFIKALENFELSKKDNSKFLFTITKNDKKRLLDFLEKELDNESVIEMILNLPKIKLFIKKSMSSFDQFVLNVTNS